jgi:hypothetical protein
MKKSIFFFMVLGSALGINFSYGVGKEISKKNDYILKPLIFKRDWTIDTIKHENGSKDIVKWRFDDWHSKEHPMRSRMVKTIRTYDKCDKLVSKKKVWEYHGCFGKQSEKIRFNRNYKSKCQN